MNIKHKQVGGNHYGHTELQPWDVLRHWRNADHMRGFYEGLILKYLFRHPYKGGVEDLRKAKHVLEKYIELECQVGGLPEVKDA